jgi:hypothetical protein
MGEITICKLCKMSPENCAGRTLYVGTGRENDCHYHQTDPKELVKLLLAVHQEVYKIRSWVSPFDRVRGGMGGAI